MDAFYLYFFISHDLLKFNFLLFKFKFNSIAVDRSFIHYPFHKRIPNFTTKTLSFGNNKYKIKRKNKEEKEANTDYYKTSKFN